MNDRPDDSASGAPDVTVANEQSIPDQRLQHIAHLGALALEARILGAECELNGFRAVAQEHSPSQKLRRHELPFKCLVLPHGEQISSRQHDPAPSRKLALRPVWERWNEIAHGEPAAASAAARRRRNSSDCRPDSHQRTRSSARVVNSLAPRPTEKRWPLQERTVSLPVR